MDTDKIQKWIKDQSFLAIFITSWMIINWDILILLFFGEQTMMVIKRITFTPEKPFIRTQISYWLICDIGLPFLLTFIRMTGIKSVAVFFENISRRLIGETDKMQNIINQLNVSLKKEQEIIDKIDSIMKSSDCSNQVKTTEIATILNARFIRNNATKNN